jgi:signal transduction histidine kinase
VDDRRDEIDRLRESRRRLVLAADDERRALERQLHDGVQQHLSALAMKLQLAGEADPAVRALTEELLEDVQQAAREAAFLAERIHPSGLEAGGLPVALRSAATRAGIRVKLDIGQDFKDAPEVAAAIYWCCLDAFTHAVEGTTVAVSVREDSGTVNFAVDGSRPDAAIERIRDRVEALGGTVTFDAATGALAASLPS